MQAPLQSVNALLSSAAVGYPARTKQASADIAGKSTNVVCVTFVDKIMVTIIQEGRLAQWVQVPLEAPMPGFGHEITPLSEDDSLLPMSHLSPKTLLGASNVERETLSHLYASQIASAILTKEPNERRSLLIGFGLSNAEASREVFYDIIDLVLKCV